MVAYLSAVTALFFEIHTTSAEMVPEDRISVFRLQRLQRNRDAAIKIEWKGENKNATEYIVIIAQ